MNLKLQNVRLSFPALFIPKSFDDTQEPKYSAVFLLDEDKNSDDIANIRAAIDVVLLEKYTSPKNIPKGVKKCLRNGEEKPDTDGYGPGIVFLSANSAKRVPVVDRDLTPLTDDSGKPYAGCYVNASIRLWVQDNKWGKRVNAQLRAVQFVQDGEAFGEKPVDVEEVFDAVEGDDML